MTEALVASPGPLCPICQSPVEAGATPAACPACRTAYHPECWAENQGCAVYGCSQVPATEARTGLEVPPAYWGQETKPCPACGAKIMAAAVRCRSCGATFDSSRPQDAQEFRRRQALAQRQPQLRRTVALLFVLCLLPCTAPLSALAGSFWYLAHRKEVAALPGLYSGLIRIGLAVGIGQTVWIVVAVVIYAVLRTA